MAAYVCDGNLRGGGGQVPGATYWAHHAEPPSVLHGEFFFTSKKLKDILSADVTK